MTEQQENQAPVLPRSNQNSGIWGLCMIISLLFSLAAGVALIWISIARNDLGYEIFKLQKEIDNGLAHITKLEVERDSLLSPYVLHEKAKNLGWRIADPGQIRRLID